MAHVTLHSVPGTTSVQLFWSRQARPGRRWLGGGVAWFLGIRLLAWTVGIVVTPVNQRTASFRGRRLQAQQARNGWGQGLPPKHALGGSTSPGHPS